MLSHGPAVYVSWHVSGMSEKVVLKLRREINCLPVSVEDMNETFTSGIVMDAGLVVHAELDFYLKRANECRE